MECNSNATPLEINNKKFAKKKYSKPYLLRKNSKKKPNPALLKQKAEKYFADIKQLRVQLAVKSSSLSNVAQAATTLSEIKPIPKIKIISVHSILPNDKQKNTPKNLLVTAEKSGVINPRRNPKTANANIRPVSFIPKTAELGHFKNSDSKTYKVITLVDNTETTKVKPTHDKINSNGIDTNNDRHNATHTKVINILNDQTVTATNSTEIARKRKLEPSNDKTNNKTRKDHQKTNKDEKKHPDSFIPKGSELILFKNLDIRQPIVLLTNITEIKKRKIESNSDKIIHNKREINNKNYRQVASNNVLVASNNNKKQDKNKKGQLKVDNGKLDTNKNEKVSNYQKATSTNIAETAKKRKLEPSNNQMPTKRKANQQSSNNKHDTSNKSEDSHPHSFIPKPPELILLEKLENTEISKKRKIEPNNKFDHNQPGPSKRKAHQGANSNILYTSNKCLPLINSDKPDKSKHNTKKTAQQVKNLKIPNVTLTNNTEITKKEQSKPSNDKRLTTTKKGCPEITKRSIETNNVEININKHNSSNTDEKILLDNFIPETPGLTLFENSDLTDHGLVTLTSSNEIAQKITTDLRSDKINNSKFDTLEKENDPGTSDNKLHKSNKGQLKINNKKHDSSNKGEGSLVDDIIPRIPKLILLENLNVTDQEVVTLANNIEPVKKKKVETDNGEISNSKLDISSRSEETLLDSLIPKTPGHSLFENLNVKDHDMVTLTSSNEIAKRITTDLRSDKINNSKLDTSEKENDPGTSDNKLHKSNKGQLIINNNKHDSSNKGEEKLLDDTIPKIPELILLENLDVTDQEVVTLANNTEPVKKKKVEADTDEINNSILDISNKGEETVLDSFIPKTPGHSLFENLNVKNHGMVTLTNSTKIVKKNKIKLHCDEINNEELGKSNKDQQKTVTNTEGQQGSQFKSSDVKNSKVVTCTKAEENRINSNNGVISNSKLNTKSQIDNQKNISEQIDLDNSRSKTLKLILHKNLDVKNQDMLTHRTEKIAKKRMVEPNNDKISNKRSDANKKNNQQNNKLDIGKIDHQKIDSDKLNKSKIGDQVNNHNGLDTVNKCHQVIYNKNASKNEDEISNKGQQIVNYQRPTTSRKTQLEAINSKLNTNNKGQQVTKSKNPDAKNYEVLTFTNSSKIAHNGTAKSKNKKISKQKLDASKKESRQKICSNTPDSTNNKDVTDHKVVTLTKTTEIVKKRKLKANDSESNNDHIDSNRLDTRKKNSQGRIKNHKHDSSNKGKEIHPATFSPKTPELILSKIPDVTNHKVVTLTNTTRILKKRKLEVNDFESNNDKIDSNRLDKKEKVGQKRIKNGKHDSTNKGKKIHPSSVNPKTPKLILLKNPDVTDYRLVTPTNNTEIAKKRELEANDVEINDKRQHTSKKGSQEEIYINKLNTSRGSQQIIDNHKLYTSKNDELQKINKDQLNINKKGQQTGNYYKPDASNQGILTNDRLDTNKTDQKIINRDKRDTNKKGQQAINNHKLETTRKCQNKKENQQEIYNDQVGMIKVDQLYKINSDIINDEIDKNNKEGQHDINKDNSSTTQNEDKQVTNNEKYGTNKKENCVMIRNDKHKTNKKEDLRRINNNKHNTSKKDVRQIINDGKHSTNKKETQHKTENEKHGTSKQNTNKKENQHKINKDKQDTIAKKRDTNNTEVKCSINYDKLGKVKNKDGQIIINETIGTKEEENQHKINNDKHDTSKKDDRRIINNDKQGTNKKQDEYKTKNNKPAANKNADRQITNDKHDINHREDKHNINDDKCETNKNEYQQITHHDQSDPRKKENRFKVDSTKPGKVKNETRKIPDNHKHHTNKKEVQHKINNNKQDAIKEGKQITNKDKHNTHHKESKHNINNDKRSTNKNEDQEKMNNDQLDTNKNEDRNKINSAKPEKVKNKNLQIIINETVDTKKEKEYKINNDKHDTSKEDNRKIINNGQQVTNNKKHEHKTKNDKLSTSEKENKLIINNGKHHTNKKEDGHKISNDKYDMSRNKDRHMVTNDKHDTNKTDQHEIANDKQDPSNKESKQITNNDKHYINQKEDGHKVSNDKCNKSKNNVRQIVNNDTNKKEDGYKISNDKRDTLKNEERQIANRNKHDKNEKGQHQISNDKQNRSKEEDKQIINKDKHHKNNQEGKYNIDCDKCSTSEKKNRQVINNDKLDTNKKENRHKTNDDKRNTNKKKSQQIIDNDKHINKDDQYKTENEDQQMNNNDKHDSDKRDRHNIINDKQEKKGMQIINNHKYDTNKKNQHKINNDEFNTCKNKDNEIINNEEPHRINIDKLVLRKNKDLKIINNEKADVSKMGQQVIGDDKLDPSMNDQQVINIDEVIDASRIEDHSEINNKKIEASNKSELETIGKPDPSKENRQNINNNLGLNSMENQPSAVADGTKKRIRIRFGRGKGSVKRHKARSH